MFRVSSPLPFFFVGGIVLGYACDVDCHPKKKVKVPGVQVEVLRLMPKVSHDPECLMYLGCPSSSILRVIQSI